LPRDLETICFKCLDKDPGRRYATALHLAEDLHRFLAGEPILARPISVLERGRKWAARRPAVAALLGALALVILVSIAGLSGLWLRAENQRARADLARASAEQARIQAEADRDFAQREQARADANLHLALQAVDDFTTRVYSRPG
jgi:hypothetical protein